jgi:iron complex outermembrane receptor protein
MEREMRSILYPARIAALGLMLLPLAVAADDALADLLIDVEADSGQQSRDGPENSEAQVYEAIEVDPLAQSETPADTITPPVRGSRFIEEIIVTAQKREENLQDVPISVSAFSGELLDAKGISSAIDLPLVTPGLNYTSLANYSIIYLRGIGTDAYIPSADLSVATYVDGIYLPFALGLTQSFGALERIEVLKGPQGTLFGRNSTGGAINIVTKKPYFDGMGGSVDVSYGRFDDLKTRVYVNLPIGSRLAFDVSGIYNDAENPYTSVSQPLPKEVSQGGRLKARWQPVDSLDLMVAAQTIHIEGVGTSLAAQISPKPLLSALGQRPPPEPYVVNADAPAINDTRTQMIYFDGTFYAPRMDIRLLLSDQSITSDVQLDFDASPLPLVSFRHPNAFSDIRTAELQFLSNGESWGSDWLTYIGGLYYIESTAGYDPVDLFPGLNSLSSLPVLGPVLDSELLAPLLGLLPPGIDPITVRIRGILDTESTAAFFQGTARITDWLSVTAGGRYQTETRALVDSTVGTPLVPRLISYARQSADTTNFSPKVSLDLRFSDSTLTYLSYSKGFKSGTYNIITVYVPPGYTEPEEVSTVELGLKTELFDNSLRLNAAIFNNDVKNIQVQTISLASGGAVAFENAGKARIRGAEFDLTWQPLHEKLPGLIVTASASYLDSEYTEFADGSGYDLTTGLFFGRNSLLGPAAPGRDFSGNRITQTPKLTGTFGLAYSHNLDRGSLEVAGDAYYNDGFFYTAQNSPRSEQRAYHVINARVSWFHEPWRTRITLFGRNVNNAEYYYYNFETDFGTSGLLQPPATYGVRLNWEFG